MLEPPLNPATREPVGPEAFAPIFPQEIIRQEVTGESHVPIPEEVREIYSLWRPTPLFRARRLEKLLDTPAHIYYKYEVVSPAGSHKPTTAVPQAYYNREDGARRSRVAASSTTSGITRNHPDDEGVHPGALIRADGLRCHGDSPILSALVHEGLVEARADTQTPTFEVGLAFARTEDMVPGIGMSNRRCILTAWSSSRWKPSRSSSVMKRRSVSRARVRIPAPGLRAVSASRSAAQRSMGSSKTPRNRGRTCTTALSGSSRMAKPVNPSPFSHNQTFS